jgi:tRNA (uracil-5-)-methyltransferase TRM9
MERIPENIENEHVLQTYQTISSDFDKSRHHVWPCVSTFLDKAKSGSSLLEIGCGNGKNLLYRKDLESIGVDFVPNFVSICLEKGLNAIRGNAISLPFSNEVFDNCISIAVFHHLASEERRITALKEMYRVLRKGGRGMIVCWAYEQGDSGCYRDIQLGDQYIGWRVAKLDGQQKERYYYCYDKAGFEKYTSNISISEGRIWWQKGNWVFEFTK